MTVGAVVIAQSTAKPRHSSNFGRSGYSESGSAKSVFPSSSSPQSSTTASTPITPEPTGTTLSPSASQPEENLSVSADPSKSAVETRSIEPDFQAAFDKAMEISLAVPPAVKTQILNEPASSSEPFLPPLERKEVSSSPRIFDEPPPVASSDENNIPASVEPFVTTTDLNLREGPAPAYLKIETLGKGSGLTVLERQGKWWRVKSAASGAEGWINGTFVKPKT
ncbi:SH3 domain-containing protein [Rhizobium sullae]|uniref:SH3 domain-containing protein n=1 Tax=Rhizobium sullae TaxID=50338 RepID=A0ABY5XE17_RHISU|nr:SH3 domain-containing protein [Rhizobium sullae]UWU12794.1 SH3 domain-containing protein [Rhizobium sullae]